MTTRMVRRGRSGRPAIRCATATVMATPAPSSIAPSPGSHESRWPPIITTWSGRSRPGISPTTFQAGAFGVEVDARVSRTRTGFPAATSRSSSSASGTPSAAAGIFGSRSIAPVCGSRLSEVASERIR